MTSNEDRYDRLLKTLKDFRDKREWSQFHTIKDLALSISVEAAELLELTQWKSQDQLDQELELGSLRGQFSDELADVFIYLSFLADRLEIDLISAAEKKVLRNEARFPIESSRGRAGRQ